MMTVRERPTREPRAVERCPLATLVWDVVAATLEAEDDEVFVTAQIGPADHLWGTGPPGR